MLFAGAFAQLREERLKKCLALLELSIKGELNLPGVGENMRLSVCQTVLQN